MFAATDTNHAPWFVAPSNGKTRLSKRQKRGGYREPNYHYKYIRERY